MILDKMVETNPITTQAWQIPSAGVLLGELTLTKICIQRCAVICQEAGS